MVLMFVVRSDVVMDMVIPVTLPPPRLKKAIKDLPEVLDALDNVDERLGIALSDVDAGGTHDPGYAIIRLYISTLEQLVIEYIYIYIVSVSQDFIDEIKKFFGPADTDIRDAKRRISVAKGPKKRKDPAPAAEIQDGNDDGNNNESSVDSSDGEDDQ